MRRAVPWLITALVVAALLTIPATVRLVQARAALAWYEGITAGHLAGRAQADIVAELGPPDSVVHIVHDYARRSLDAWGNGDRRYRVSITYAPDGRFYQLRKDEVDISGEGWSSSALEWSKYFWNF